ncbi:thioredoxin fold domain-containing protein [Sulfitobacter sp. M57]|uniref:thioredoxin family protein n=1 Tax=unclassified Sulfitobacter TaxID=196795 RepID=UPI0023E25CEB|nr:MULTISPECIES: thioredoxin family protein [unclassified Sulfitobacter]MDF3415962.1 thioredoxin fold domain-containing protein [Sulfitobacter sp. KE5]MDF3423442.1 thioredoxin fold domain-containing protein [Sulfitobacter sp. KE43]MDF3434508.1 thioredoxin fold domain-containing protein [Sulfitobacter sp. KE42]MDF3460148.1 thioredoxin fold domain-containing protein [Sulfitobacter sp. S74]MDF3464046.1 thioredoxin fold domain-containing protein [Sulfitobacter sp. Ks18]
MRLLIAAYVTLVMTVAAFAAELGDDGLHKAPWMRDTFKDLSEDLAEATGEGKRLMVIIEQRGCIYCEKMHEEVFPVPEIAAFIEDKFFVVQINMFGDVEVTDFDGTALPEKEMVKKWGALFTPMILFFPEEVGADTPASQAAVATMPGAFGRYTTFNMLNWVVEKGYDGDESFQRYHARKFAEQSK